MKKNIISTILLTFATLVSVHSVLGDTSYAKPFSLIEHPKIGHFEPIKRPEINHEGIKHMQALRHTIVRSIRTCLQATLYSPKTIIIKEQINNYAQNYGLATTAAIVGITLGLCSMRFFYYSCN